MRLNMTYKELLDTRIIDGFTIKIYAEEEHLHPDDIFDWQDDDDREKTLLVMEKQGLFGWFCATVKAYKANVELSSNSVGGCSYQSAKEFLNDGYCIDLIDQTLTEAKLELPKLINELKKA